MFYTEEKRAEILKNANSEKLSMQGITQAMEFSLYDLLAAQINELQRLNNTLESIFRSYIWERHKLNYREVRVGDLSMYIENSITLNAKMVFEDSGETLHLFLKVDKMTPKSKKAVKEELKIMLEELLLLL